MVWIATLNAFKNVNRVPKYLQHPPKQRQEISGLRYPSSWISNLGRTQRREVGLSRVPAYEHTASGGRTQEMMCWKWNSHGISESPLLWILNVCIRFLLVLQIAAHATRPCEVFYYLVQDLKCFVPCGLTQARGKGWIGRRAARSSV